MRYRIDGYNTTYHAEGISEVQVMRVLDVRIIIHDKKWIGSWGNVYSPLLAGSFDILRVI